MLRKLTSTDEPERLILLCDPSVWEAQLLEARRLVDEDLEPVGEGDFMDVLLSAIRATTGPGSEMTMSLSAVRLAGGELLDKILEGEEKENAAERLNKALAEEDIRLCLAYVRAQAAAAAYRESSDPSDLLNSEPEGATHVIIKAPTKEQLRRFERGFRPRPRLGEMYYNRAGDVARKAARRSDDAGEAFSEFIAGLDEASQSAIDDYENWVFDRDCDLFALAVHEVEGFPLFREGDRYPVAEFLNYCVEAEATITEAARHIRTLCSLGKSERSLGRSSHGSRGSADKQRTTLQTAGAVLNAPAINLEPNSPD